VCVHAR